MGALTAALGLLSTAMWIASLEPAYSEAHARHLEALQRDAWLHTQCADPAFSAGMLQKSETAGLCDRVRALYARSAWEVALGACVPPLFQRVWLWLCEAVHWARWPLAVLAAAASLAAPMLLLPLYRASRDEFERAMLTRGRRALALPRTKEV